jgi:uncharacterized protein CbrC (UPF0167 family)
VIDDPLPAFRYHPDPVATGAFERLGRTCIVCGQNRGWNYVFGTYGPVDLRDSVCPWCIVDGSAAERFDVVFTDLGAAPDPGDEIPIHAAEEIERRTPGFSAWQQERWLAHCDDAAAFLGPVGWDDLEELPDAVADIRRRLTGEGVPGDDVDVILSSLDPDGDATGYLFRCLACGTHLAYADMD